MAIQIKIDQAGKPAGVPGYAREDLALGVAVDLEVTGGVGVTEVQWSLLYSPPNEAMSSMSSAALTAPFADTTQLTPIDNVGTYRVRVEVNQGFGLGVRSDDVATVTFYAGPTLAAAPDELPRRRLAWDEGLDHNVPDVLEPAGNSQGWAREWERWFRVVEAAASTTLAVALARGNVTGGTDIELTTGDEITGQTDVVVRPANGAEFAVYGDGDKKLRVDAIGAYICAGGDDYWLLSSSGISGRKVGANLTISTKSQANPVGGQGEQITVYSGDSDGGAGGQFAAFAGDGATGGAAFLYGGEGGHGDSGSGGAAGVQGGTSLSGNGGAASCVGGAGVGVAALGGDALLVAGANILGFAGNARVGGGATTSGTAGWALVIGGAASGAGAGGAAEVYGGDSLNGAAGSVTISGGSSGGAGTAGDVNISGGTAGGGVGNVYLNSLRWPQLDGASGTALVTNGAGVLSFGYPTDIPYTSLLQTGPGKEIKEPSGWPVTGSANDANVRLVATALTRKFTLDHQSDYSFWAAGQRFTKTGDLDVTWPNTAGTHYFYFDTSGTLQTTMSATTWLDAISGNGCPVAALLWHSSGALLAVWDERHGFMEGQTHRWAHQAIGALWVSGGALSGFTISTGAANSHAQWNCGDVVMRDEDISDTTATGAAQAQTLAPLTGKVWSYVGTEWVTKAADGYMLMQSGAAYTGGSVYVGANGRIAYNSIAGGVGSLVEAGQGNYVLSHVFVTTERGAYSAGGTNWTINAIVGQAQYTTVNAARDAASTELNRLQLLSLLPAQEMVWLGTVILQTSTAYGNTPKARVVQAEDATGTLVDYIDWRGRMRAGGGGGGGAVALAAVLLIGNTTSGTDLEVSTGDELTMKAGSALVLETTAGIQFLAEGSIVAGDDVTISTQDAVDATTTGMVILHSGANAAGGASGKLYFYTPNASTASGGIELACGIGSNSGGSITATAGAGVLFAGELTLTAGAFVGASGNGGAATLAGGAGAGAGVGGAVTVTSGTGGTAGSLYLQTGGVTRLTVAPTVITSGLTLAMQTGAALQFLVEGSIVSDTDLTLETQGAVDATTTGLVVIHSGVNAAGGSSGKLQFYTGSANVNSGAIELTCGMGQGGGAFTAAAGAGTVTPGNASVAGGAFAGADGVGGTATLAGGAGAGAGNGGDAIVTSGTGAAGGNVLLQTGGVTRVTVSPTLVTSTLDVALGTNPAATGVLRLPNNSPIYGRNAANNGNIPMWSVNTSDNIQPGTSIQFGAGSGPFITQADNAADNATGYQFQIRSQFCTGLNSTGGELILLAGTGTATNGKVTLMSGFTTVFSAHSTYAEMGITSFRWASAAGAPTISQVNNTTNSATASTMTVQAQNATGTTATGGGLTLTSGTGTSAAGNLLLQTGGVTRVTVAPTLVTCALDLAVGGTVASAGAVRLANNVAIAARNSTNDGDLNLIKANSSDQVEVGAGAAIFDVVAGGIDFVSTMATPVIRQATDATATVTGDLFTINAQDCSGGTAVTAGAMTLRAGDATGGSGTRNGGKLLLRSGTGASANGDVEIQRGTTQYMLLTLGQVEFGVDIQMTNNDVLEVKNLCYNGVIANGNSGTSKAIDWNSGDVQSVTMTGNCTFTFTAPPAPARLTLILTQDGTGNRTATFPAAVLAPGGKAAGLVLSTAASAVDKIEFYYNGTSYYALINKAFAA